MHAHHMHFVNIVIDVGLLNNDGRVEIRDPVFIFEGLKTPLEKLQQ